MKTILALLVGVTVVCLALAASSPGSGLVVHEWGTFTSVQGSDGVLLEGLQHEEEPLPKFVHSLAPIVGNHNKGLTTPAIHVTQKMETPVLYFHTAAPQKIRVKVGFNHGLISQWYPAATSIDPAKEQKLFDISRIRHSSIQWDATLTPWSKETADDVTPLELNDFQSPWKSTRDVAAATVSTGSKPEKERFLFYRGLGNFTLPISVHVEKDNQASLLNSSKYTLPAAFALEMGKDVARFTPLGKIESGQTANFSLDQVAFRPADEVVTELKSNLQSALVEQGLFEDEARAMVNTWSRQWFRSHGTRLIYLVPRETTDELLPLQITPAPEKLVRVLVGRLEYMTPETEAKMIRSLGNLSSKDSELQMAAWQDISWLGRFLEPHILRAMALSKDATVQDEGRKLIEQLKPAKTAY